MTETVLICRADGTQELVEREVIAEEATEEM